MKKVKKLSLFLPILAFATIGISVGCSVGLSHSTKTINKLNDYNTSLVSQPTSVIKNSHQEYLQDNSISLAFIFNINKDYVIHLIDKMIETSPNLQSFINNSQYLYSNQGHGTAWMFDYSIDPENQNLATYYLASNTHVLDLHYELMFKNKNGTTMTINIPVNKQSVTGIHAYISQPRGNVYFENDGTNLDQITFNKEVYNNVWYELPNIDVIGLGAYNNKENTKYLADIEVQQNQYFQQIGFSEDGRYLTYKQMLENSSQNPNQGEDDISILKTQIGVNETLKPKYNILNDESNDPRLMYYKQNIQKLNKEFSSLNKMFYKKGDLTDTNINSTFIDKLRFLNQKLDDKTITEHQVRTLVPFSNAISTKLEDKSINLGGFPGQHPNKNLSVAKYYGTEISYNSTYWNKYAINNRLMLKYWKNGQFSYEPFNYENNLMFKNGELHPGSSGSMVLNSNNQVIGIYWGRDPQNNGVFTPIMTNPQNNIVFNWLKYQNNHDKNSQLLRLFTSLYNYNFSNNNPQLM